MGSYQLFVLGSLVIITLIVMLLGIRLKKVLHPMQGMIISMFYGMSVGLTAGVLVGMTFQGNLFHSTFLSIAIGVFAGSLFGLCFGLLSVLEGIMAGLMGGMMGAMVGEMMQVEQSATLIQMLLLLTISTIFVILIMKTPQNARVKTKKWLLKPILLAAIIAAYIIGSSAFV